MKFKVGDRVNIIGTDDVWAGRFDRFIGITGTITEVPTHLDPLHDTVNRTRYYVALDGGRGTFAFWGAQLETAVLDELAKAAT